MQMLADDRCVVLVYMLDCSTEMLQVIQEGVSLLIFIFQLLNVPITTVHIQVTVL